MAAAVVGLGATLPVDRSPQEPAIPARIPATFPAGWGHPAGARATFEPHAMVASDNVLAAQVGAEVMRQGGNAVDAAVATGFALAVTFPEAGNLGGGGYMVIRLADGRVAALDYREVAPLAATRDMYVGADGKLNGESVIGPRASGVPGAVAGMLEAHRKYGRLPVAKVLAPAIRLAAEGFTVDSTLFRSLTSDKYRIESFAGKSVFLPNGAPPPIGSRLRQPQLARTIRLISDSGTAVFYRGSIADSIAAQMRREGGLITKADLARYRPVWRDPIRSSYRGYSLITMPPSSSGGITVTEMLNVLEAYGPPATFGTAERVHAVASASQRAFVDRNSKLGDPAFVRVPLSTLTSKSYARSIARSISRGRADPTTRVASSIGEGNETTHWSVVDQAGNAVATTSTLNDLYGSGVYISGAGFFLNDEMDDFTSQPGTPNMYGLIQGEANSIAPGKRMLSAMTPTIMLDPKGNLLLVTGARGGPRIISATAQIILNVIDHRMSLADAMSAPRLHHQALPDSIRLEAGGFDPAVISRLKGMGHHVYELNAGIASATSIMRVKGGYDGMGDPRSHGGAAGF
ncbi:MAG: gamma-glutamyltranspeptidase / glutathione hydrolase [Gemmatimonadaceae bacterium]|nr:gamma-glutamyltranspeptidase / glutathione hydrolase [Gemmatimonadaceae bacterium]